MPDAQWPGLCVMQLKARPTLARHQKQVGLKLLKVSDVCNTAEGVQQRHLTWHLHLAAFFYPDHTKRKALLVATFDQVKVANFENLQRQHAVRKQAMRQGKKRNCVSHVVLMFFQLGTSLAVNCHRQVQDRHLLR